MSDYLKLTWDGYKMPEISDKDFAEFKEYMKHHPFIPWPDPFAPSMPFKKWEEMMDKRYSAIVVDESTRIKPKLKASINSTREPLWAKVFKEWLKEYEDDTD